MKTFYGIVGTVRVPFNVPGISDHDLATIVIPQPDAPAGYQHTNEYRCPKPGEHVLASAGHYAIATGSSESFSVPFWILRKTTCGECGREMP